MSGRLWHPAKKLDIMLTVYKSIPSGHGGATCRLNSAANDDEFLENVRSDAGPKVARHTGKLW